jgi:hypothetical protein
MQSLSKLSRNELLALAAASDTAQTRAIPVPVLAQDINPTLIAPDPDVIRWIEHNFYVPELMGPVRLAPYQKAALREALRKDDLGNFVYSLIVWSDIKKSIKSTIAAALALYVAYHSPWGSVKIIANDLDQADSRVNYYIRRAIELNPKMKKEISTRGYTTTLPNKAMIKAIPIDPEGEAGGMMTWYCTRNCGGRLGQKQKECGQKAPYHPPSLGSLSGLWKVTLALQVRVQYLKIFTIKQLKKKTS